MPVPQLPSQPTDHNSSAPTDVSIVVALKQIVAQLQREQLKIQDLLSSLGFALRSLNNLNQFLDLIPLMATRVTDADGGALFLYKPNGEIKLERLHWQDSHQRKQIRQALEAAINQFTTAAHDAALALATSLEDQMQQYLPPDIQLFGTSILVRQTERGRLYVFSRNPEYSWTESKQKLVRFVADQTAVGIENDELTVELRKKERLDRELEIGAEIQSQLLPRQCPTIPGVALAARCKPANRVGGDYYDFIPTNDDPTQPNSNNTNLSSPWGLVIGDVMGKGVPAGLIMTMTRGMLRAEVLNGHSPGRILQHLNRVMYADLENSHRFITLFYSEYDPQTRILYYSNAAHNPPLLWQATTGTVKTLDTPGMLIGLDANSQYEDGQTQLAPGDTIMYFTDGFTEAANHSGERFEEHNLIEAFSWACKHSPEPQAILDYLFEKVEQFIGSATQHGDDMTLVVFQVQ
ncbi:MAG: PP2C family protein-serine/threonine phosphatase [Nostocaceae cyanobacterium]|nr:PP2C family protein-serine/threonine phosphatase [Nostocaceae cyanobacterium]